MGQPPGSQSILFSGSVVLFSGVVVLCWSCFITPGSGSFLPKLYDSLVICSVGDFECSLFLILELCAFKTCLW